MEILQFLKYTYRQDRLDLMDGIVSSEQELLDAEATAAISTEIQDLLAKGQIDELMKVLDGTRSASISTFSHDVDNYI